MRAGVQAYAAHVERRDAFPVAPRHGLVGAGKVFGLAALGSSVTRPLACTPVLNGLLTLRDLLSFPAGGRRDMAQSTGGGFSRSFLRVAVDNIPGTLGFEPGRFGHCDRENAKK